MISLEALREGQRLTGEVDARVSIGVVLVVVASETGESESEPLVWTIIEQQAKKETDKVPGQISFPAETRKVGEQEMETVLGAVAELTDSDEAIAHLHLAPETFYAKSPILVKGRPVDVAFLVYDGPRDSRMQSMDLVETSPNGWMPTGEIQRLNGEVRGIAHDSLDFANLNNVFSKLARDRSSLVPLSSFLQPGFSIKEFVAKRDQQSDIPLT